MIPKAAELPKHLLIPEPRKVDIHRDVTFA